MSWRSIELLERWVHEIIYYDEERHVQFAAYAIQIRAIIWPIQAVLFQASIQRGLLKCLWVGLNNPSFHMEANIYLQYFQRHFDPETQIRINLPSSRYLLMYLYVLFSKGPYRTQSRLRRSTKLVTMTSLFDLVTNGRACIFFPFMGADQHGNPLTWPKCGNLNLVSMETIDNLKEPQEPILL